MKYEQPGAGGSWEHRSGDCAQHGGNIPFAKPYHSSEPYLCVECMLTASCILAERELLAARVSSGSRAPEVAQNEYTATEADALERAVQS